jgi:hypothetical protein
MSKHVNFEGEDMFELAESSTKVKKTQDTRFKAKHSLDSDEEDEDPADQYERLDENDIEGWSN